ncbi:MAG: terpene cyclase/mutase family protein, partial [Planctomycetes bacterium]|nr:terpene cyclase/mutase family protein [Planctomycetota bacterium]
LDAQDDDPHREWLGAMIPKAIEEGITWLTRAQREEGFWEASGSEAEDWKRVPLTALAIAVQPGYGHTHKDGSHPTYVESARRGAKWLLAQQQESGSFAHPDSPQPELDHALSTLAITELLILSGDTFLLRRPTSRALQFLCESQRDDGCWSSGATVEETRARTAFCLVALGTAKTCCEMRLIEGEEECRRALERALSSLKRGSLSLDGEEAAGVLLSLLAAGMPRQSIPERLIQAVADRRIEAPRAGIPEWFSGRYGYLAVDAMFRAGGSRYGPWVRALFEASVRSQRRGRALSGSWDPLGPSPIGATRVGETALRLLALEICFRFSRHEDHEW